MSFKVPCKIHYPVGITTVSTDKLIALYSSRRKKDRHLEYMSVISADLSYTQPVGDRRMTSEVMCCELVLSRSCVTIEVVSNAGQVPQIKLSQNQVKASRSL